MGLGRWSGLAPRGSRDSVAEAQPHTHSSRTFLVMRLVLEWLGLTQPDPARKEPVAVPVWAPYVVAATIAVTATGLAALLRLIIGASV